jgi:hypothetical protein
VGGVQPFTEAEASEFFEHVVFQLVVVREKKRPRSLSFMGPKRMGVSRVLNRYCGEDEGERSAPCFAIASLVRRSVWDQRFCKRKT